MTNMEAVLHRRSMCPSFLKKSTDSIRKMVFFHTMVVERNADGISQVWCQARRCSGDTTFISRKKGKKYYPVFKSNCYQQKMYCVKTIHMSKFGFFLSESIFTAVFSCKISAFFFNWFSLYIIFRYTQIFLKSSNSYTK